MKNNKLLGTAQFKELRASMEALGLGAEWLLKPLAAHGGKCPLQVMLEGDVAELLAGLGKATEGVS